MNNPFFRFMGICLLFIAIVFGWYRASICSHTAAQQPVVAQGVSRPDTTNAGAWPVAPIGYSDTLPGSPVKYATYPATLTLTNHMLLETTQTQVTLLINKGVTKQQLTDAMDKLAGYAFLDSRTNIVGSVYPVFWNTKEQDGNVLGLSLEVQLPGDVKVYIMNKQMLSDTIVGFTYNVGHSSLTIYY